MGTDIQYTTAVFLFLSGLIDFFNFGLSGENVLIFEIFNFLIFSSRNQFFQFIFSVQSQGALIYTTHPPLPIL
jgi:hypothetical protein